MAHQFTDVLLSMCPTRLISWGKQITLPLTATETNNTHGCGALFLSPFFLWGALTVLTPCLTCQQSSCQLLCFITWPKVIFLIFCAWAWCSSHASEGRRRLAETVSVRVEKYLAINMCREKDVWRNHFSMCSGLCRAGSGAPLFLLLKGGQEHQIFFCRLRWELSEWLTVLQSAVIASCFRDRFWHQEICCVWQPQLFLRFGRFCVSFSWLLWVYFLSLMHKLVVWAAAAV